MAKTKKNNFNFDFELYTKLLKRGLCSGKADGKQVCIEAAVCIATGETTPSDLNDISENEVEDHPSCVDYDLCDFKISLNDSSGWTSEKARAKGLHDIGIAQLGTNTHASGQKFFDELFNVVYPVLFEKQINKMLTDKDFSGLAGLIEDINNFQDNNEDSDAYIKLLEDVFPKKNKQQLLVLLAGYSVQALRNLKSPGIAILDAIKS